MNDQKTRTPPRQLFRLPQKPSFSPLWRSSSSPSIKRSSTCIPHFYCVCSQSWGASCNLRWREKNPATSACLIYFNLARARFKTVRYPPGEGGNSIKPTQTNKRLVFPNFCYYFPKCFITGAVSTGYPPHLFSKKWCLIVVNKQPRGATINWGGPDGEVCCREGAADNWVKRFGVKN